MGRSGRDNATQMRRRQAGPRHRPRHLRRLPCLRDLLQGMEHRRLWRAAFRPLLLLFVKKTLLLKRELFQTL